VIIESGLLDSWAKTGMIEPQNLIVRANKGSLGAFVEGDRRFVIMGIAETNAITLSVLLRQRKLLRERALFVLS
jgi:hypothetical protein